MGLSVLRSELVLRSNNPVMLNSEEEVEKELQAMADQYKMDLEKIKASMGQRNLSLVENDIRMRKAIDFVFENAVIE